MNNRDFFDQSIFKNNPKDVFRDLGEQVFNQFSSKTFPTNIYNQANQYILEAELPGVNKSEIELTYEHSTLTISVQKHVSEQTGKVQLSELQVVSLLEDSILKISTSHKLKQVTTMVF